MVPLKKSDGPRVQRVTLEQALWFGKTSEVLKTSEVCGYHPHCLTTELCKYGTIKSDSPRVQRVTLKPGFIILKQGFNFQATL